MGVEARKRTGETRRETVRVTKKERYETGYADIEVRAERRGLHVPHLKKRKKRGRASVPEEEGERERIRGD